jgi:hypothetical protein
LQDDRNQVDDNEKDDELADDAGGPIPDRAVMEDFIEAVPRLRDRPPKPRLHADPLWLASVQRIL